jgi:hypothetical protein
LAKVREIDALAERAGFSLADMRAFDQVIPAEKIAATRAAADARKAALA